VSDNFLPVATATRKTAEERRDEILVAARAEFARHGLHGASTDAIARKAGISQPYLFRLFGTKKDLFTATAELCFGQTLRCFVDAAAGKQGEAALEAMGEAYLQLISEQPDVLRAQMQGYAAANDPEIRTAMNAGFRQLVELAERISGADPQRISQFFAAGMLLNVLEQLGGGEPEPWAERLLEGCKDAG
jgi:AcrR family transcriptional regulator